MSRMNWDGNIHSGESGRVQKPLTPEDSSQKRKATQPDQAARSGEGSQSREGMWSRPRRPDETGGVLTQPVRKPEHTVVRSGYAQMQDTQKLQSDLPTPPPSVSKESRYQETAKPIRKPEHTVVRRGYAQKQDTQKLQSDLPTPPPSVGKGSEQQEAAQPTNDAGTPVSINVKSYRRHRNSKTFGGEELLSPVNIIGMLITVAGIVPVVLNWHTVTLTLAGWVLYAFVNLGTILLLLVGIAVLVFLIRGRRGRGGMLRRMFR